MSIDKDIVKNVAHLARIEVDEAAVEPLLDSINNILNWVEQLNEVDTENVKPMASVHGEQLRLRADRIADGGQADAITANAPDAVAAYFTVPKVVE